MLWWLLGVGLAVWSIYCYCTAPLGLYTNPLKRPKSDHSSRRHAASTSRHDNVLIIGGGASGLTMAARLKEKGIEYLVVDANERCGDSWRQRYERLHLHTANHISSLPGFPFPSSYPEYVSKDDFATYLDSCAAHFNVWTSTVVNNARFDKDQRAWTVKAKKDGQEVVLNPKIVICCTGQESVPKMPSVRQQDTFKGTVIHSSQFYSGEQFRGQQVLVVGFGNSGAEIALALWETDASTSVLIRSPVAILPRWLTRLTSRLYSFITATPPHMHDDGVAMAMKYFYGDLCKHGIQLKTEKVMSNIVERHRAPVQDLGTVSLIRRNEIQVYTHEIERFTPQGVAFTDGNEANFDAVIFATGYDYTNPVYSRYLEKSVCDGLLNEHNVVESGVEAKGQEQLYFVGFNDYAGRIRHMHKDTRAIVDDLLNKYSLPKTS